MLYVFHFNNTPIPDKKPSDRKDDTINLLEKEILNNII